MKKNIVLFPLLALFLILMGGCALEPVPPPCQVKDITYAPFYHRVEIGETLWSISQTHGVNVEALMRINDIPDPTELEVGQMIRIIVDIPQPKVLQRVLRWSYIVIHHSATKVGNAEIFDREHRRRGFRYGLAYHFVISNGTSGRRDGQIEVGYRWENQIDSACTRCRKMRQNAISICLVGNFNYQFVSSRQFASLVWLVKELKQHYGIPLRNIIPHRDVDKTYCPGKNFPWSRLKRSIR